MSIAVDTKDCTALSDAELVEMADLCAEGSHPHEVGTLSKQAEAWVLITQVRDEGKLKGFAFSTLERIGGTPCVLVGLASVRRTSKRDTVLRALVQDLLRRAVLAFPDEDVLVSARFGQPGGFDAFRSLNDIVPRAGHRASGEERAWGGRLAKRYGIETQAYNQREFVAKGDGGGHAAVFDHESQRPEQVDTEVVERFEGLHPHKGDSLVAFGWAMEEDLRKLA
ncbi:MAG TPA: hypothetical protein VFR26_09180 [Acidimicrobiales bacterium]|nr:hypothetical protein [Acidimicrobiales bacterium]